MPFVKIDTGMLLSTVWIDLVMRNVFLTALLSAEPREYDSELRQLDVRTGQPLSWSAPPGRYGYIAGAPVGLVDRSKMEMAAGLDALARMGEPEAGSRSQEFDGRRMIRIEGGLIVLNYSKYRDRDYTAAQRSKRYRERHGVASRANAVTGRNVTQAEAEEDLEKDRMGGKGGAGGKGRSGGDASAPETGASALARQNAQHAVETTHGSRTGEDATRTAKNAARGKEPAPQGSLLATSSAFSRAVAERWPDIPAPVAWEAALTKAFPDLDLLGELHRALLHEERPGNAKRNHRRYFENWLVRSNSNPSLRAVQAPASSAAKPGSAAAMLDKLQGRTR